MVIPDEDPSFFKPVMCEDFRVWFMAFAKDEGMAKAIVKLESKNKLMMHLRIGRHWASRQRDYTFILANLYNMVYPAMALHYAAHPLVHIGD